MARIFLIFKFRLWFIFLLSTTVVAQNECIPCADGLEPFLLSPQRPGEEGYDCNVGVAQAATLESGSPECLSVQLATFQGSCCDVPPEQYCTLCENGSQNFNTAKLIPKNAEQPFDYTCERLAQNDIYIQTVDVYGDCSQTERVLSRSYCECDGLQPTCNLLCDDGNPPPDLNKLEPIFGESCARFAYEYNTLSETECPNAVTYLNFDAKAFCCDTPAPENCSVCPEGQSIQDPDKIVKTERFGNATCGQIAFYASFLPAGECTTFINVLLDNPFGASEECCLGQTNAEASSVHGVVTMGMWMFLLVFYFFSFQFILH